MTTMQAADTAQRLALRQLLHTQESEMQRMLRKNVLFDAAVVIAVAVGFSAFVSGQIRQGPASLDDVLVELRGIRADLAETSSASVKAQLLVARLQLQQQRIYGLMRQIGDVQNQSVTLRQRAQGSDFAQIQQQMQEFANQEAELNHQLSMEQARWSEYSDRLDTLERALPR
jgi:chromosome segregation ATPase